MSSQAKVLRHIVLFKFNNGTSSEDIAKVESEFNVLTTAKVPQVKEYEWGTNVSKEGLNHGYTHCFVLTFDNEEDRDIYIHHPDHVAFVGLVKQHVEDATVLDFWASK